MRLSIIRMVIIGLAVSTSLSAVEKKNVSFKNGDIALSGTLYLPKGEGPFPALVFVHGSGPETRKNSSYSAKWLSSIGYAALIYDKRGTGKSQGEENEWNRFSFENLANDVVAAVNFLTGEEKIDSDKIGLHASSQGGWVAPLAASKTNLISFMVIRSASVTSVGDDRIFERSARLKKEGFSDSEIAEASEMQRAEAKTSSEKEDTFSQLFETSKAKAWFPRVYGGNSPFSEFLVGYRKWYATIVDFDPFPLLKSLEIPVFWIFGDPQLDSKGPVEQSINNVDSLKKSGKVYTIVQFDGVGHNIPEKLYERTLYDWLNQVNRYTGFKFRKH
ncbi:MAG: alpha/beta fold hydrolase [Roseivirga sp.]|nr:alpha/beta fold hydrolase [Roseivirga sp.]